MNKKKDDAGCVIVLLREAVSYYRLQTGKNMTIKSLMKKLRPDMTDGYLNSLASYWQKGSCRYRPSRTELAKIVEITGVPMEKLVKQSKQKK